MSLDQINRFVKTNVYQCIYWLKLNTMLSNKIIYNTILFGFRG